MQDLWERLEQIKFDKVIGFNCILVSMMWNQMRSLHHGRKYSNLLCAWADNQAVRFLSLAPICFSEVMELRLLQKIRSI